MSKPRTPLPNSPGKVIIIGATSGIGRELARVFARKGYKVAVSGRRIDLLISLQKEFSENIVTECFDVKGKENIVHLRNMIEKQGGVDIIIYSSGYGEISKELDWDIERQTTEVIVNGFLEIACHGFNYFMNQGHGQIAVISSVALVRGNALAPAYNAGKAYQSNYMEGLYFRAKKINADIAVTDIRPGFVDTAMAKGDGKFWVATPARAAQQIFNAIINKKKVAYVTRRWWLIAILLKNLPGFLYKKIG